MIPRVIAFACLLSLSFPHLAATQEPIKPPLNPRIITATRQVTMFSGIEKQMFEAVQKKDKSALQAMLTDECAIHVPDSDPMPCDEWVDSVMSKDFVLKSFLTRQMSVSDLGTAAVVSYDRVLESSFKGQNDGGEFYVVDLWKQQGDTWKLADRYVSKVGSKPVMPKGPVKPTGKQ
jgi:ketosteroid isomerase-like protein